MTISNQSETLDWPLMEDNVLDVDRKVLIEFLKKNERLTQSHHVAAFEKEWSEWVGVKYSVFVNSGSSANLITLAALKERDGLGEVIVPTLTWVSDIAAVMHCGFTPVFVDIDPKNLGMATDQVLSKLNDKTKAVFLTHILGYNALTPELVSVCKEKKVTLIEDCCESHGARFQGQRIGSIGDVSNFSFYFAHHLSTIEGGMVCTNDEELYQMLRVFRSHGLVRESNDQNYKDRYHSEHPDLDPQFIFAFPAYNVRSSEVNAVIGRSQLPRLQSEIDKRNANLKLFLDNLDSSKYYTEFDCEGVSNYAFTLVLRDSFKDSVDKVTELLNRAKVEYRRGTSGGGNQLRQPYLKKIYGESYKDYPVCDHVHFYGFYFGNYPGLDQNKILKLCQMLNAIS